MDAAFLAISAQSVALPDLRGAYAMRVAILATMIVVIAGAVLLGAAVGGSLVWATVSMGALALLGGWWRHLSSDYGPTLSVSSALLFLLGVAQAHGGWVVGVHLAKLVLIGGAGSALLQMAFWPFRPQHALRAAVAESWVAASDLIGSLREEPKAKVAEGSGDGDGRNGKNRRNGKRGAEDSRIAAQEQKLRETLDRTFVILGAAERRHNTALLAHLEEMRREVVHLAMRVVAFEAALAPLLEQPEFSRHKPTADSVLKALSDAARSVALTLISHRSANFNATEIRLRRCRHLLCVLDEQLAVESENVSAAHARAALEQVGQVLPRIGKVLRETIDHGDVATIIPSRLPDLTARSFQSLAAWINPAPQADPVLIRYALRMATLTMLSIALYKGLNIPRGYWMAFTIVAVLQPDYGSTRERAFSRIGGTLAGSALGSALLWAPMPFLALLGCAMGMAFGFAYYLKTRYGVAVFFVTLMLVLVTETSMEVHLDFTITRLLSNLAGGAVALLSAVVFWPIWEGEKFTVLLATAMRANRSYFEAISGFLCEEGAGEVNLMLVKRRAENANRFAAASLQRMLAEPKVRPERAERATALTTYIQRVTRAGNAIAIPLHDNGRRPDAALCETAWLVAGVLESLAGCVEKEGGKSTEETVEKLQGLEKQLAAVGSVQLADGFSDRDLIWTQLVKSGTEIRAMTLALEGGQGEGAKV